MFLAILLVVSGVLLLVVLLSWVNADHPKDNSEVPVICRSRAPGLTRGQKLKVMTYNVQFLAGKNYVFFHDTPDLSGPDTHVAREDVLSTADGIARIIIDESPDVVFFQELDDGSRRTDYVDQLSLLLERLPSEYACYASAFYWKIRFVPHPKLFGPLGMKTAIVSKYGIDKCLRCNLPGLPVNFFLKQFSGRKLILQAFLPVDDGSQVCVMSTHLDAFTVGSDIMTMQLNSLRSRIHLLDSHGVPWILGGDFNLLPPGQYERLIESHRSYYNPNPEIKSFAEEFRMIPTMEDAIGGQAARWFTYHGNDARLSGPDRTLDYIVYSSRLRLNESHVRQSDVQKLSDHFPVIASFEL